MSSYKTLVQEQIAGIRDIIPAYCTITIVYNPLHFLSNQSGAPPFELVKKEVEGALNQKLPWENCPTKHHQVPVCYHQSLAPDLAHIAQAKSLSIDDVINHHHSVTYRVYMIGFLPGFPYMATVDEAIATPRHATPRTMVPAGSVGVAGHQTGIYPSVSPGGWQLIGQTPVQLFNAHQQQPSLFQPGDLVSFYPISLTTFRQMKAHGHPHS